MSRFRFPLPVALILLFVFTVASHAATVLVSSREDSGPGTLRQALVDANNDDTINFSISGESNSITVYTSLAVNKRVAIMGTGAEVIGSQNPAVNVLVVTAAGATIQNVAIVGGLSGIRVDGVSNVEIYNCRIGTNWLGDTGRGAALAGIYVNNANHTVIGALGSGNLISGNGNVSNGAGIILNGATNALIQSNVMGLDAAGTAPLGNFHGFHIIGGSLNCVIGGNRTLQEGNVISGNNGNGIVIVASGSQGGHVLTGNIIGLDAPQANAIPNNGHGIAIVQSPENRIGGSNPGDGNVIACNLNDTIYLENSHRTVIQGNYLGIDHYGNRMGINGLGVVLAYCQGCLIGGSTSGARNYICGFDATGVAGIQISDVSSTGNTVTGNSIGINASGDAVGNDNGIHLVSAAGNLISNNVIGMNDNAGILLDTACNNTIVGNTLGLNAAGTVRANWCGVMTLGASAGNRFGSAAAQDRNVISGNHVGIYLGPGDYGSIVQGNWFGTNGAGSVQRRNDWDWELEGSGTLIGGAGAGNVCAGQSVLAGSGNTVAANSFGLLPNGTLPAVPASSGIVMNGIGCHDNWVGLPGGPGNLITGVGIGIDISGSSAIHNAFYANTITACTTLCINSITGANNSKTVPVITSASTTLVSGTAAAGDSVEVFAAEHRSGEGGSLRRLGTATASGLGAWSLAVSLAYGDYVTGIATDANRNSSAFATNYPLVMPTATPTATISATVTVSPTLTASPTHSPTPTITPTAAATATPTVTQTVASMATGEVRAFPNPGRSQVRFWLSQAQGGEATVEFYNMLGERVAVIKAALAPGLDELVWNCGSVAPGMYMARVKANGVDKVLRIAIVK